MTAVTVNASRAADPGCRGPVPARAVRSWPLLVLAAPAAAEVWSSWVGIAEKTGFRRVSFLPSIWPSVHLDTAITQSVGVDAYAAYALRAWLASEGQVSARTRRFAKWSAIFSFALGMAGRPRHTATEHYRGGGHLDHGGAKHDHGQADQLTTQSAPPPARLVQRRVSP